MADSSIDRKGYKRLIGLDFNYGSVLGAGPRYWTWVTILMVFAGLGAISWYLLLTQGGAVLNMRDSSPWGLWFVNYMYFVGLSAGGLVIYASVHLFNAKEFAPLSRLAVLQAGILVMMALLSIVTDMERPWRAVWMLLSPNPSSPFIYTGSAANLYMILCFTDLWILITGKGGHKMAHRMTLIALPAAIYLHTTTAFVLSLNKSRELWHTAMMVPIFLTSATASGIALLIIFAYVMQKFGDMEFKPSMFQKLVRLLSIVIIVDLFFLGVEMITIFWPTSAKPGHVIRMAEFFVGRYAWLLLPVFIIGLTTVIILMRRRTRVQPKWQLIAAATYVFAIFLKRYALLAMGFSINTIGQQVPMYFPSPVELFLALGIVAFGLLFVTFTVKLLPMKVPVEESDEFAAEDESAEEAAPGSVFTPGPAGESAASGASSQALPSDATLEPGVSTP